MMPIASLKPRLLEVIVFITGAVVMIFEIIGSRILAPFLGASTYTWTSLIGVILAALSIGYYAGGKFADRRADLNVLAAALFTAAGAISATVLTKEIALAVIAELTIPIEFQTMIAALILFAPASVALGFVGPVAAKISFGDISTAGSVVGRLYALSTIGSIAGTFLGGFFFIPFIGSVRTLYILVAALVLMGVCAAGTSFSLRKIAVLIFAVMAIGVSEFTAFVSKTAGVVLDRDTEYNRVLVFGSTDKTSGRPIRVMTTDPFSAQSAMFTDSDELVFEYTKFYHLIKHFKKEPIKAVMIGGAGFSFPKSFVVTYRDSTIDVVEIDPGMTAIAREHFDLAADPRMNIHHEDGRVFLRRAAANAYDAVFIDAFSSSLSIPVHLTTVEAVADVKRILAPEGIVILNIVSAIEGPASEFLRAELRTYRAVFPHVLVYKVKDQLANDVGQNIIVVAFNGNFGVNTASGDAETLRMLDKEFRGEIAEGKMILTDDLAPVEWFNSAVTAAIPR